MPVEILKLGVRRKSARNPEPGRVMSVEISAMRLSRSDPTHRDRENLSLRLFLPLKGIRRDPDTTFRAVLRNNAVTLLKRLR